MSTMNMSLMKESKESSSVSHQKRMYASELDNSDETMEQIDSQHESSDAAALTVTNGVVEFNLASAVPHFICPVCSGLFRDPVTINECLHTFCKSCLYPLFTAGKKTCPACDFPFPGDPFKSAMNDRTLESLCDKVLFTDVKECDDIEEKQFYASRGIQLKPELGHDQASSSHGSQEKPAPVLEENDKLEILLHPDARADEQCAPPKLERFWIKTSGRLKIFYLKRYLLENKLGLSPKLLPSLEISCNDIYLGNELSLHFIERTMWLSTTEKMRLAYRFSDEVSI